MTTRDPWAERYNRRTRAIERQAAAEVEKAEALAKIAEQMVTANEIAALSLSPVHTSDGTTRSWTNAHVRTLMGRVTARLRRSDDGLES